jgi:NADH-quinone oxidoreductase subunit J
MTIAAGLFIAITIAGALLAVNLRNILHAVFGLAVALFGIAGLFLVLNSPFVATMQVLIYIGGISIAMIFVIMLSPVVAMKTSEPAGKRALAALASMAFFAAMAVVVHKAELGEVDAMAPKRPEHDWGVKSLGDQLLDHYNVVFEALSLVLLLAIVGAIVIAKRDTEEDEQ